MYTGPKTLDKPQDQDEIAVAQQRCNTEGAHSSEDETDEAMDGEPYTIIDRTPNFDLNEEDGGWIEEDHAEEADYDDDLPSEDIATEETGNDPPDEKDAVMRDLEVAHDEASGTIQDVDIPAVVCLFRFLNLYAAVDKYFVYG